MGNLQTIVEMILFSFTILAIFSLITASMETKYPGYIDTPAFAQNTSAKTDLINTITGSQSTLDQGNVNFDSQSGLSNPSVWGILYGLIKNIWNFVSGNFIRDLFTATNLGGAGSLFATSLQALWIIVLVGIAVFTFFKVRSV